MHKARLHCFYKGIFTKFIVAFTGLYKAQSNKGVNHFAIGGDCYDMQSMLAYDSHESHARLRMLAYAYLVYIYSFREQQLLHLCTFHTMNA
jgi:hypothetical protein